MRLIAAALALTLAAPALAQEVRVGELTLERMAIREAPAGAPVAGGYLVIRNDGAEGDRLLAAASPAAGEVQIHRMRMEEGVMRMRPLPDGIEVPAGETVALRPGGDHLMLMRPEAMAAGEAVEVTLAFERAGEVTAPFPVQTLEQIREGMTLADKMAMEHGGTAHGAAAPAGN